MVELVLEGKVHSLLHVRNNDESAHGRRQIVVRVSLEIHVLGEVLRLHQFPDIVKIGTNATERGVGTD